MDELDVTICDDNTVPTPDKVGAKELETLIIWQATKIDEPERRYTLGRYGVMSVFVGGNWMPVPSLPDFEGILKGGRQFIFDTKVCSQASYALTGGTSKSFKHQYKHMQRRAKFGALCCLFMHFGARKMKTKEDPAFTIMLPIYDTHPLWEAYERGEQKSITRQEAKLYGIPVRWHTPGQSKVLPALYEGVKELERVVTKETETHGK